MSQYGLLGEKLGHSYSKIIHEKFGPHEYELVSLPPAEVRDFVLHGGYHGFNITIPYKKTVMPYLDFISETAEKIGSVNTVIRAADGKLSGYNTDYYGFAANMRRAGITLYGKYVVILGSGGTSVTAHAVACDEGAASVTVVSRTAEKAGQITYEQLYASALNEKCEVLINTTPIGMYPNNNVSPVDLNDFPNVSAVIDVIYNPLMTSLILQARKKGILCADGLYMLVAQAAEAFNIFHTANLTGADIETVYNSVLRSVRNIVLIGMPGCGKTSVGKLLAERFGMTHFDTDEVIVKNEGVAIVNIFETRGNDYFRECESRAAAECGKMRGAVISTGGGIVTRSANYDFLKQNGIIVYIERDTKKLEIGNGRPLSTDFDKLQKMFFEREPLYKSFADYTLSNDGTLDDLCEKIYNLLFL